jgi:CheY-like chemotaxis protein
MSKRILLIDSDAELVASLTSALEGDDYEVITRSDGKDAVEAVRRERPDGVVLSVELPRGSGYAICSKLKKDESLKEIPVVLVSSEATQKTFEDHAKLKIGRADGYLLKPFEPEALLAKLSGLVGAVETLDEADLDLDDEPLAATETVGEAGEEPVSMDVVEEISVDDVVPTPESLPSESDVDALDDAFHEITQLGEAPHTSAFDPGDYSAADSGDLTRIEPFPRGFSGVEDPPLSESVLDEHDRVLEALQQDFSSPGIVRPSLVDTPLEAASPEVAPEEPPVQASAAPAESPATNGEEQPRSSKERETGKDKPSRDRDGFLRLREEMNAKEKQLLEQREQGLRLERQLAQKEADLAKRDTQIRQLLQKVETLVAGQRRTEKELTTVREEFLQAEEKHTAVERERATSSSEAQRSRERAERAEAELRDARAEASELTRQIEDQHARVDELSAEIVGVRAQFEEAQAGTEELRRDMERQREEDDAIQDDLRRHVSELEEAQTRNEDRVVKAYQRIKGDERVKEKTRKALSIALQLLEDQSAEADEEEQRNS